MCIAFIGLNGIGKYAESNDEFVIKPGLPLFS